MSQYYYNAKTIQRAVRNKEIQNAFKKLKETIQNQTNRVTIIRYLSKYITTNTCKNLLLGSEDLEVLKIFSSFDKQRVTLKARHIADALQSLVGNTAKGKATTWIQCCERAIEQNYFQIKRARNVADWYQISPFL